MIESYDEFFAAVNRVAKGHTGDEKCSALGQRENREQTNITHFFFFLAKLHNMWDLSALTRDRTCNPCTRSTES